MTGSRVPRRRLVKVVLALASAAAAALITLSTASADAPPYSLPVSLPGPATAPSIDAAAPYTPAVLSLIAQLEPTSPPAAGELANADLMLHDTPASTASGWPARPTSFNPNNVSCHNVGPVLASTGTTPSIQNICWTDAQGVLNTSGPNARGSTGPMTLMGLGATFDRDLANAWGQTEGTESRAFMVTGMFGPQTDLDRIPNWGRNLTTTGEDPYLSSQMVAAQINGMQGVGAMSEMKHFVVYNGQNQNANTDIGDQGLHELYLTPYEGGFVDGRAAATMCSYQIWRDTSTNPALADPIATLTWPSPYANPGENPETWPLNQSHFSCEQPLSLTHVLRGMWGSAAMVGTDYPAQHSTSGIFEGMEQEMPTTNGFMNGGNGTNDPTGSTCAYYTGNPGGFTAGDWDPNCTSDSAHIGGIPNHFEGSSGTGCPAPASATGSGGCTLNQAVLNGVVPLSVFNQSLARVLYQEQRFGMLGCDPTPTPMCTSPGGIGSDRSGNALLPSGPASGATPGADLGTENGDAAVAELTSEEGSVLFKNDGRAAGAGAALPIRSSDLTSGNVALVGAAAEYAVASPSREASQGFPDRIAINPLTTLGSLSGNPGAFVNVPADSPTGFVVPTSALRTATDTPGLSRTTGNGSPSTDSSLDFTAAKGNQLSSASTLYTWKGCLYVPAGGDSYTFRFQNTPNSIVTFALSTDSVGGSTTLSAPASPGDTNVKV